MILTAAVVADKMGSSRRRTVLTPGVKENESPYTISHSKRSLYLIRRSPMDAIVYGRAIVGASTGLRVAMKFLRYLSMGVLSSIGRSSKENHVLFMLRGLDCKKGDPLTPDPWKLTDGVKGIHPVHEPLCEKAGIVADNYRS